MAEPSTTKVLLIGWDAADWKVAAPLMDAGQMPNLERLVSEGVMGNLATLFPVLSPMLWTSIATGKRAHKHGIHGFAEPDPRTGSVRPVTSLGRTCKAVWNILHQSGKRANVVGWWPSHPVEPINGVMVSNHFQQVVAPLDKPWPVRPGTIHPAELGKNLAKFRVHPAEFEAGQLLPFVPEAAKIDQKKDRRLSSLAKILAETASVHAVATAIVQMEPWDFMGVYYDGIDHFCHGFMRYHPPRLDWVNEEDYELYKDVINGSYQFHDLMLGTWMQLAGEDTTIILISDHGFHSDQLRPREFGNEPAGAADEHRQFGLFVMRGPGVKRDELVFGASLLDIAPTILHRFGLPVGRDMDGGPLLAAYRDPPQVEYVESWESIAGDSGRHPADAQIAAVDAHESLKQLVELGYIDKPDENKDKAVADTVKELRHNLARSYIGARMLPEAIALFEALWDEYPDEARFGVKLFECHVDLGRPQDAREVLDRLVREKKRYAEQSRLELAKLKEEWKDRKPEDFKREENQRLNRLRRRSVVNTATFAYLRGTLLKAEGEHEKALDALKRAEGVQSYNRPSLYQKMGECLVALRRWEEAAQQFDRVLDIDAINPNPHVGLAQCHLGLRRPRKALDEATAAVGLGYHNPTAHLLCGRALRGLRRPDEAVRALETAIAQNPVFPEAHRQLADIYRKQNQPEKAAQHDKLAAAAQDRIADFVSGKPLPADVDLDLDVRLQESVGIGDLGDHESPESLPEDAVVIVSGLPRSGTSMMMQMLSAGGLPIMTDGVRAADESNPRGYLEFELAKKVGKDNTWLSDSAGKAVKIVAQLLPNLPLGHTFRIIFMERPLGEVIASQTAMLERLGREGSRLSQRQLAAAWSKDMEKIRRVLQAHADRVSLLAVNYHDTLSDSSATAARVNTFLGGELDAAAMAAAVDPALRHQRAPASST